MWLLTLHIPFIQIDSEGNKVYKTAVQYNDMCTLKKNISGGMS